MKIEIDLKNADQKTLEAAMLAILHVSPEAVGTILHQLYGDVLEDQIEAEVKAETDRRTKPKAEPAPEPEPEAKPAPELKAEPEKKAKPKDKQAPSYNQFTFDDRTFSIRKGGPNAAYKQALDVIDKCGSADELASKHTALLNLRGIFDEIGREDLVDKLMAAHQSAEINLTEIDGDERTVANGEVGISVAELQAYLQTVADDVDQDFIAGLLADEGVDRMSELTPEMASRIKGKVEQEVMLG